MSSTARRVRTFCLVAMMAAVLESGKLVLSSIANVEVVTLLLIVFTKSFGARLTLPAAVIFILVETVWWGFGIWVISYFLVWPLLILVTSAIRSQETMPYVLLSAGFGLAFGALCAMVTLVIGGPAMAFSWWAAGIPYDIVHCISNGLLAFFLMKPLLKAARLIAKQYLPERNEKGHT